MPTVLKYRRRAVVVTALKVEFMAVRDTLKNYDEEEFSGTIYEKGEYECHQVIWEIILVLAGAGNPTAATETERAIRYFYPSVIFFVGVAGGVKDVAIGDIVVGSAVHSYESGASTANSFFQRTKSFLASYAILQRASAEARSKTWNKYLGKHDVFVGAIAAGEKVVKSKESAIAKLLRKSFGDVLAVEMEGGGFLSAVHANNQLDALVIRGISDLLDNKSSADSSGSQELASRNAAAFMLACLNGVSKNIKKGDNEFIYMQSTTYHNFNIKSQHICLTITDDSGSAVDYEKKIRVQAFNTGVLSYIDFISLDGQINSIDMDTGKIEYIIVNEPQNFILSRFERPLRQWEEINRTVRAKLLNAFTNHEEWWYFGAPQAHERVELTVNFPKNRICKRCQVIDEHEQDTAPSPVIKKGGRVLSWVHEKPNIASRYKISWEW